MFLLITRWSLRLDLWCCVQSPDGKWRTGSALSLPHLSVVFTNLINLTAFLVIITGKLFSFNFFHQTLIKQTPSNETTNEEICFKYFQLVASWADFTISFYDLFYIVIIIFWFILDSPNLLNTTKALFIHWLISCTFLFIFNILHLIFKVCHVSC